MPIEDIFSIEGRGTSRTGKIERGMVKVNEEKLNRWTSRYAEETVSTGIEMF
jgi:translation elongation factor EF-Tu-like GTPase